MVKILGKILKNLLLILLSLILCANLWLLGARALGRENPKVLGYSWAVVLTGSMEPAISGNDLVIAREQKDYQVGDVIMFQSGNVLVTHRIVAETQTGFTTQGDANNTPDTDPVRHGQIQGKIVKIIPGFGRWIRLLGSPLGMMCLVFTGLLLVELPWWIGRKEE